MSFCRNESGCLPELKTTFTNDYPVYSQLIAGRKLNILFLMLINHTLKYLIFSENKLTKGLKQSQSYFQSKHTRIYLMQSQQVYKGTRILYVMLAYSIRVAGQSSIGIISTLQGIALVYTNQGDLASAIEYYLKSLQIRQQINGRGSINSASAVYNLEQHTEAQEYLQYLQIGQKMKDKPQAIQEQFTGIYNYL